MRTKNLQSLIKSFDSLDALHWEKIAPYKKLLYVHYKNVFCCEPIFMVTFLTNSICAGYIVPENDFDEYILEELNLTYTDVSQIDSDAFIEYQTIITNSQYLKNLIQ